MVSTHTSRLSAIEVNGLEKSFGGFKAVDSISFQVNAGEVYGFLGPNGAGKTTTIKSILDLIHADAGTITINGLNMQTSAKEAKRYVGYLPERVAFYDNLTAYQNLCFYAEINQADKEECTRLINEFGLADAIHKRVGTFSKGMLQRLGMARAILGNPPILILDEPSGGLDPRGVVLIRDKIKELKSQGSTIFVSSHILSEIQAISDRVAIINKGKLVAKDSVENLRDQLHLKPKLTLEIQTITKKMIEAAEQVPGVVNVQVMNQIMNVSCAANVRAQVVVAVSSAGGKILNLYTTEPSLEEVFMRLTEDHQ